MSSIRIKERLSTLVPSQLPEFVRSDYETFVAFLEAYYEYLEQDGYAQELIQNSRKYSDIDLTVDSFIDYFIKQYIDTIPKEILVNKKLLIKNIKDLYNTKGSKKSFDLLFRILFNKSIEVFYPSTQILKASDGKWKQKTSFFMQILSGSPDILLNNTALIKTDASVYPIVIEGINSAFNINGLVNDVKEFLFTNDKNYPLDVGNEIEYENFKGRIVAIPNKVTVINPGTGFKVGDILPVTSGVGFGARLKVSRVNSTGGIRNVQFINYGYGYEGSFYNYFTSREGIPQTNTFEYDAFLGTVSLTEGTRGFVDFGTITVPRYATDYFAQDYEGDVARNFYTNSSTNIGSSVELGTIAISIGNSTDAALYIQLGGLARYPGYYETIDGFLSDEIFLENEEYYQTFTYVLKIDERLKDFKKAVLDLLHPAGTKLLGEFNLTNTFDSGADLTSQLRLLISRFQDQINSFDNIPTKNLIKPVDDSFTTTPEIIDKHVGKRVPSIENPNDDNIDVLLETISKTLGLNPIDSSSVVEDSIPTKGVVKQIGDPGGPYASNYFLEDYTTLTEFILIEDELVIIFDGLINTSDELTTSETGYILNTNYASDYTDVTEDYAGEVALIS
jgi:hypothetical protein